MTTRNVIEAEAKFARVPKHLINRLHAVSTTIEVNWHFIGLVLYCFFMRRDLRVFSKNIELSRGDEWQD